MRHNKKINHLSRTSSHRAAMLANMACSLIKHKRINTTTAKAKALKKYIEPLITKSKEDTTHSRRTVFAVLHDKNAVSELFRDIAGKVADRPGGYTRIIKTGFRLGDNAQMCFIELVDFNDNMLKEKAGKKSARTRRSGKKAASEDAAKASATAKKAPKAKAAPVEEKPVEEMIETPQPEVIEAVEAEVAEAVEVAAPEAVEVVEAAEAVEAEVVEEVPVKEEEAPVEEENTETKE